VPEDPLNKRANLGTGGGVTNQIKQKHLDQIVLSAPVDGAQLASIRSSTGEDWGQQKAIILN
jgi:hypothetical protein